MTDFMDETSRRIASMQQNADLLGDASKFLRSSIGAGYSYNFLWQGRPIIQYPQDIQAMQEIVWTTRPDLIIETGIAHGGSLILSASLLTLLDYEDAQQKGQLLDPRQPKRRVLGIDIDIRQHNRSAIEEHPQFSRIDMIEGSSIAEDVVHQVRSIAADYERVMLLLDSNHTHAHVSAELEAYASLVTPGCYCVVFDTVIEDLPRGLYENRPWDVGDNPKTAVQEFLACHPEFAVDRSLESKLLISVAPSGYLRRAISIEGSK